MDKTAVSMSPAGLCCFPSHWTHKTLLYCTALHYTALYVLHYTTLYRMYCTKIHFITCTSLHYTLSHVLHYTTLYNIYCTTLHFITCTALQYTLSHVLHYTTLYHMYFTNLHFITCSVLQFPTLVPQLRLAPRFMIRVCRSRHGARLQGDKKGRFCGDRKLTSPRRETNSTNVGGKKVRTLRLGPNVGRTKSQVDVTRRWPFNISPQYLFGSDVRLRSREDRLLLFHRASGLQAAQYISLFSIWIGM